MKKDKTIIDWASFLVLILLLTASCQENTIYHSFQPVKVTGWNKSDTLIYSLPQTLAQPPYLYEIGIRHKDSYPYRDIWLSINRDTVHLYLADSLGYWIGNGIGEIRQLVLPVSIHPSPKDSIKELRITHLMQDNPLKGIHDIGLRIRVP